MGMKGNNFGQRCKLALLSKPVTVKSDATASIDGAALNEPWRKARQIAFFGSADVPAASGLTVKLIGKKRSDASWVVITDKAGADIQFPTAKLGDGGTLETAGLLGVIDVEDLVAETYSDYTLRAANSAATSVVVCLFALLVDLLTIPSDQVDEFAAVVFA